jgi:hypothetical protein
MRGAPHKTRQQRNTVEFADTETAVVLSEVRGQLRANTYGYFFLRKFADGRITSASPELERHN